LVLMMLLLLLDEDDYYHLLLNLLLLMMMIIVYSIVVVVPKMIVIVVVVLLIPILGSVPVEERTSLGTKVFDQDDEEDSILPLIYRMACLDVGMLPSKS